MPASGSERAQVPADSQRVPRAQCATEFPRHAPTRPKGFLPAPHRRRSKRAPAREISWVMDSSGQGESGARTEIGSAKDIRGRRGARFQQGVAPCAELIQDAGRPHSHPADPFPGERLCAGVPGGTLEAESASNGHATHTRAPNPQRSARCKRMPSRAISSVCAASTRIPSGPRQRMRAGSRSRARGCLRNSRGLGAEIMRAYRSRCDEARQTSRQEYARWYLTLQ